MRRPTTSERSKVEVDRDNMVTVDKNWRKPVVLTTKERKSRRFYRALHVPDVDFLASVSWRRFGSILKVSCAITDVVILTNNYRDILYRQDGHGTIDVGGACNCPGESIRQKLSVFSSC